LAWQRSRGIPIAPVPRATVYALAVPPSASLLLGIVATDLDLRFDWVIPASFWLFATLLLLSIAAMLIVTVRCRSQRSLLLAIAPLHVWLALCVNWASLIAVSGFGRHWR
jgi:hypothetical protein